jgi:hypothetical protein
MTDRDKVEHEPRQLQPCPCGTIPENLVIEVRERAKYGLVSGSCCSEWHVEFRNGYTDDNALTTSRAADAWNQAPRL